MRDTQEKKKTEALEALALLLAERVPAGEADRVTGFMRHYYGAVAPEDLLSCSVDDLYGQLLSVWAFLRHRKAGEPKLRIYHPNFEEHGWQSSHTIVEIATDDMPFLVDSASMELRRQDLTIHLLVHPVLRVRRDRHGELQELCDTDAQQAQAEAVMHFEVDRLPGEEAGIGLAADLRRVLADVTAAVEDWPAMVERLERIVAAVEEQTLPVPDGEKREALDFLRWLGHHHFTFIGFRTYDLVHEGREYQLQLVPESGLGIFRQAERQHVSQGFAQIPPHRRQVALAPSLLVITKSTARSTIHRPAHLDYVGVKRFGTDGQVVGEWRFLGLFSSSAYSATLKDIPLLRRKASHIMQRSGFAANSHDGKTLQHILETFPRDEMFQADEGELFNMASGILQVQERHKLRLFIRRDIFGRFVTALVYVPRDRYNTELRERMQALLVDAFGGLSSEFNTRFSESVLARVHFIIRTSPEVSEEVDLDDLQDRLAACMLSWDDHLQRAMRAELGEARCVQLDHAYARAFPLSYQEAHAARAAVVDIKRLEAIGPAKPMSVHLYRSLERSDDLLGLKVYGRGDPPALSDILPLLERLGLHVLGARPYHIARRDLEPLWILDFGMRPALAMELELQQVRDRFQEAFLRVSNGEMESDGFNRLVLAAGLDWRQVVLLRTICKYLLQTGVPFSQSYMEETLSANLLITHMLVELFETRFQPDLDGDREQATARLVAGVEDALEQVANLDEDRIVRRFLATILATLRTNYYQRGSDDTPRAYLSLKLNPSRIPEMPLPHPMFEIFVYSPRIEGVHLRGGKVARGGLRWSDRREDFRTEVLGLMKAQMVKNAVIVPVGAKGGFVAKQLPASGSREAVQQEVVDCYRTFIRGLLDITDNLEGGEVRSPTATVRYDGDDPYLVVAADKGTATFSDLANEVAAEYGFWLGDAFASGGSSGYDHKKMGITARGAWESVKRHFRELGKDIQSEPFTVVGIGDMGGDVFGNGMLLSERIRLVAAFNHLHIFIDPDPDPEISFRERQRLFALPRSTWEDYDSSLLSRGGGIYPRSAKLIRLSPEARTALGIEESALRPNELIRCLLKAPVELLWNGGIGTYVKAKDETHDAAGDRANDAVRVNARELRCRVVGEGGNLGFTQQGRIEYARAGGYINTDAIDNSGGVDCSDHEVNIKILLGQVESAGDLTRKQRDELLVAMTDEVAGLVLRNNYIQTESISVIGLYAPDVMSDQVRMIRALEKEGRLNRELEALPSDEEIAERENAGTGLTRPEIAVLLAYGKIELFEQLVDGDIAEDAYLSRELKAYFPRALQERFQDRMQEHPLRREIIATHITNSIINHMGSTFSHRMQESTGASASDLARAYTAAREIVGARQLWSRIEALDNQMPAEVQLQMINDVRRMLDRATVWLLRNRRSPMDINATIARYGPAVEAITAQVEQLLDPVLLSELQSRWQTFMDAGSPGELARAVTSLEVAYTALDIADAAESSALEVNQVADIYFRLGVGLDLPWLLDRMRQLPRRTHWEQQVRDALRDDLFLQLRQLTMGVLGSTAADASGEQRVQEWLQAHRMAVDHCRSVFADIRTSSRITLAMLSVALREVSSLGQSATS